MSTFGIMQAPTPIRRTPIAVMEIENKVPSLLSSDASWTVNPISNAGRKRSVSCTPMNESQNQPNEHSTQHQIRNSSAAILSDVDYDPHNSASSNSLKRIFGDSTNEDIKPVSTSDKISSSIRTESSQGSYPQREPSPHRGVSPLRMTNSLNARSGSTVIANARIQRSINTSPTPRTSPVAASDAVTELTRDSVGVDELSFEDYPIPPPDPAPQANSPRPRQGTSSPKPESIRRKPQ